MVLVSVPAEWEEKHCLPMHMDEEVVQDDMGGDADAKSCFAII